MMIDICINKDDRYMYLLLHLILILTNFLGMDVTKVKLFPRTGDHPHHHHKFPAPHHHYCSHHPNHHHHSHHSHHHDHNMSTIIIIVTFFLFIISL